MEKWVNNTEIAANNIDYDAERWKQSEIEKIKWDSLNFISSTFLEGVKNIDKNRLLNSAKNFFPNDYTTQHKLDDIFSAHINQVKTWKKDSDRRNFEEIINKIYDIFITWEKPWDNDKMVELDKNILDYEKDVRKIFKLITKEKKKVKFLNKDIEKLEKDSELDKTKLEKIEENNLEISKIESDIWEFTKVEINNEIHTLKAEVKNGTITEDNRNRLKLFKKYLFYLTDKESILNWEGVDDVKNKVSKNNSKISNKKWKLIKLETKIEVFENKKNNLISEKEKTEEEISEFWKNKDKRKIDNKKEAYEFFKSLDVVRNSSNSWTVNSIQNLTKTAITTVVAWVVAWAATVATWWVAPAVAAAWAVIWSTAWNTQNKYQKEEIIEWVGTVRWGIKDAYNFMWNYNYMKFENTLSVLAPPIWLWIKATRNLLKWVFWIWKGAVWLSAAASAAILETWSEVTKHIWIKPSFTNWLTSNTWKAVNNAWYFWKKDSEKTWTDW